MQIYAGSFLNSVKKNIGNNFKINSNPLKKPYSGTGM